MDDFQAQYERDVEAARNEVEKKISHLSIELYSLMRQIRYCPKVVSVKRYNQFVVHVNEMATRFDFAAEDAKQYVRTRVVIDDDET